MKKTVFILSLCAAAMTAQAELKVSDNGKVGVQIDSATPLSSLSVGYAGSTNHKLSTPLSSYRAWGVLGQAGNATSGYNYGVFGLLNGSNNGAAVVGAINDLDVPISGVYAGYFQGNVIVTGLIAQELQELYPDLVYEDGNGYLSVNYVGLVPILIEAVKELKAEISELQTKRAPSAFDSPELQTAVLYQNAPNPFSQTTEIRYYLSETVKTAYLTVYDMQGKQLKRYDLATRGAGSQTVLGSEFAAGMYLYALIADGQEVDVKRMI